MKLDILQFTFGVHSMIFDMGNMFWVYNLILLLRDSIWDLPITCTIWTQHSEFRYGDLIHLILSNSSVLTQQLHIIQPHIAATYVALYYLATYAATYVAEHMLQQQCEYTSKSQTSSSDSLWGTVKQFVTSTVPLSQTPAMNNKRLY